MKKLLLMAFLSVAATSCFRESLFEGEARVAADRTEVCAGAGASSDTLVLTANRSWTSEALSSDAGGGRAEWLTLSPSEGLNVSGASERYSIIIGFDANAGNLPRCAEILIHCNGGMFSIPVIQKGL